MAKVADLINAVIDEVEKFTAPIGEDDRINLLANIEHVRCKYVNLAEKEKIVLKSELVYCKDCKHGQQVGGYGVLCEYGLEELRPMDHFCAWGEVRSFEPEDNEEE